MLFLPPSEIEDKIIYSNNDVIIREGCKLTPKEEEIYNKFRIELKKAIEDRFK